MHPTNSGSPCLSQLLGGAPASPPPPHSPPTCAVALPSSSPHESLSHTPSPAHPGPRKKGVVLGGQPGCLPTGVQFALESTPVPSALEPLGQRLLSPRRRVVSFGRAGGCQSSPGLSLLASPGFPFRLRVTAQVICKDWSNLAGKSYVVLNMTENLDCVSAGGRAAGPCGDCRRRAAPSSAREEGSLVLSPRGSLRLPPPFVVLWTVSSLCRLLFLCVILVSFPHASSPGCLLALVWSCFQEGRCSLLVGFTELLWRVVWLGRFI